MRDKTLIALRPVISNASVNSKTSNEEAFQNITLRPIIKFQHDLLIEILKNYFVQKNVPTKSMSSEDLKQRIKNATQKDVQFKSQLLGTVVGLFSLEEFGIYTENASALNKRILRMLIQRFQNSIDQL